MKRDEALSAKQVYDQARYRRIKAERESRRAPDPITLIDETTAAYLAGLTDADGSIFVTHTNRLRTYYPAVVWAMTHKPTIEWVAGVLHGTAVQVNNHTALNGPREGWPNTKFRTQWKTIVAGSRAQLICTRMLPYLHTKAAQAALVLAFPCDARSAPGVRLPDEIRAERVRLGAEVSALNRW